MATFAGAYIWKDFKYSTFFYYDNKIRNKTQNLGPKLSSLTTKFAHRLQKWYGKILLFLPNRCAHRHTPLTIKMQDSVLGFWSAMDRDLHATSDMIHDLYKTNHFTGASERGVSCDWVSLRNITSLKWRHPSVCPLVDHGSRTMKRQIELRLLYRL